MEAFEIPCRIHGAMKTLETINRGRCEMSSCGALLQTCHAQRANPADRRQHFEPRRPEHLEGLAVERDTVPLPSVGCKPVSQPNMGQPVPLPCAGCKTVPLPCAGCNPAPQSKIGRKLVAQSSVGFKAALCSPGMAHESILRFRSKFGDLLVLIQAFSASLGVYWSSLTSNRTNILPNLPRSRDFGSRG